MKGSAVRIRASALRVSRDFSLESSAEVPGSTREGSTRGLLLAAARPFRIASLIVMRRRAASRMTCAYVRAVKGVRMADVLGDLVERAALVEEQRGARVAKVVAPEVGDAGAVECRDPKRGGASCAGAGARRGCRERRAREAAVAHGRGRARRTRARPA